MKCPSASEIRYSSFPRVRAEYQIHLWAYADRRHGALVSAKTGKEQGISRSLALALRLMTGERSTQALAEDFSRLNAMDVDDAETALVLIAEQFCAEGVIELSAAPLAARTFSRPLTSAYQLRIIQLQLTNKCNLACPHCYADSGTRFLHELSLNDKLSLIDQFSSLGGIKLFLTGGETLLDPHLDEIIRRAKERHLFVYLSTNGLGINERTAERLVNLGVGAVNVSIDGARAETHDAFRGRKGAHKQALRALRAFNELGVTCASHTTLFKGNLDQSVAITDRVRAMGIANSFFVRMMPQGRGAFHRELIPDIEEYATARESEYRNRKRRYGVDVRIRPSGAASSHRCSAAVSQLYIRADGMCFPCPSLDHDGLLLGIYPEQSLADIWGTSREEIAELRCFDPRSIPHCRGCRHQSVCHGGCAGNSLMVNGDWRKADPHFCITMAIRERVSAEL